MARLIGVRNADYDQTRTGILRLLRTRLLQIGNGKVSFREMADAAGISVPTLRHYFGTRTKVLQEVFAGLRLEGEYHLQQASKSDLDLHASMQQAAEAILAGTRYGQMGKVHGLGLTEGLGDELLGPSYLDFILEPSLQAIESRLKEHQTRGELNAVSLRYAALAFAAPLLLASLHQEGLGGDCVRPLDLDEFAKSHVEAFVRAYTS